MKRFFIPVLTITSMVLVLTSCTQYHISTNSFIDSESLPQGFPTSTSFAIIPSQKYNELFAKEVAAKVSKILVDKGYCTSNFEEADYYLYFDFGMESSIATINVPKYIPGQTQTTQGSVYGSRGGFAQYQQTTQSSGTTTYVPESYTFFTRDLTVTVYDAEAYRKEKKENLVWHGRSVSNGSNGDLRQTIDYLLVKTFDKFGTSTGKIVSSKMDEDDKKIRWLRGGERTGRKVTHWDEY